MYLTEDEGRERLTHPGNLVNAVVEFRRRSGRPAGTKCLSPAARSIVAQAARVLPPIDVARTFGITRRTASNLARGVVSNSTAGRQNIDKNLKEKLDTADKERTASISEKALEILVATLDGVDPSKVKSQTSKVKMAKDLATIHEKMNGGGKDAGLTRVLIYTPRQKEMKEFDVLDISATRVG